MSTPEEAKIERGRASVSKKTAARESGEDKKRAGNTRLNAISRAQRVATADEALPGGRAATRLIPFCRGQKPRSRPLISRSNPAHRRSIWAAPGGCLIYARALFSPCFFFFIPTGYRYVCMRVCVCDFIAGLLLPGRSNSRGEKMANEEEIWPPKDTGL